MPWYHLSPTQYEKSLLFSAENSEASAARADSDAAGAKGSTPQPWRRHDAEHFRRQARRLRAMAKLCRLSTASRSSEIDFRRLNDPTHSRDDEDRVVLEIEGL